MGAVCAERKIMTSSNGTSFSARHELRSRAFLFIVYRFCRVRATHKCLAFSAPPSEERNGLISHRRCAI